MTRTPALLLSAALAASWAHAGAGIECRAMEYARLKDSSRKELVEAYCSDTRTAKLNSDLRQLRLVDQPLETNRQGDERFKELRELGAQQVACVRSAEDAAGMLSKKFKAPRPTCPN